MIYFGMCWLGKIEAGWFMSPREHQVAPPHSPGAGLVLNSAV